MGRTSEYARRAAPGFVGGFLGVILTASVAEYIRIEIQKEGHINSVEKVLDMKQDEYRRFSVGWKQALAQVAIEPEHYTGQTIKFLSTLSAEQANLMDIIAARVLGGEFLMRDNNERNKHPIADVTLHDFLNLQGLGIRQTVATGLEMNISSGIETKFRQVIRTNNHVLSIEHSDSNKKLVLAITTLTDSGKEIVSLLRKSSNLEHLKWLSQHIRDKGFETRLWASWTAPNPSTGEWQAKYPIKLD